MSHASIRVSYIFLGLLLLLYALASSEARIATQKVKPVIHWSTL